MGKSSSRSNPGYISDKSKVKPDRIAEAVRKLSPEEKRRLKSKLVQLVEITQEVFGEERVPFGKKDFRGFVILIKRNLFDDRKYLAYPLVVYVPLNRINVYGFSEHYRREAEGLAEAYEQETGEKFEVKVIDR